MLRAAPPPPRLKRKREDVASQVVVNGLSQAVVILDAGGHVVTANDLARGWCGLPADGLDIRTSALAAASPEFLECVASRRATLLLLRSPHLPALALNLRPLAGGLLLIEVSDAGGSPHLRQLLNSALADNDALRADNEELRFACEAVLARPGAEAAKAGSDAALTDLSQELLAANLSLLEQNQQLQDQKAELESVLRQGKRES